MDLSREGLSTVQTPDCTQEVIRGHHGMVDTHNLGETNKVGFLKTQANFNGIEQTLK